MPAQSQDKALQLLQHLTEKIPAVLFQIELRSNKWYFNYLAKGFNQLFGISGKNDPILPESISDELLKLYSDKSDQEISLSYKLKKGEYKGRWIGIYGTITQGETPQIDGFFRDITSEKEQECQLQRSRNILLASIEESPSGVLIAEPPDVHIIVANPAALGTRGGKKSELVDIDVNEHVRTWQTYRPNGQPYDPFDLPLSRAVLKGERTKTEELIIRDEKGNDRNIIANAAPVFNSSGEVEVGVVMWNDITDLKKAEKEMLQEKNRLEIALNGGRMGSWEVSASMKTIKWFGNSSQVFDLNPEALPESLEKFMEVIHEEEREMVWRKIGITIEKGIPFSVEHRIYDSEKNIRWLRAVGEPQFDANGSMVGMSGVVFDISNIKETQKDLRRIQNNLETLVEERTQSLKEANHELESFAYSVSHDLRAPLRGIDGFSFALLQDYENALDDTAKHYLKRIRKGVQRMSDLIDDILKLSKITRKDLILKKVNLSQIAQSVFNDLSAHDPERTVRFEIDEDVSALGDEQFLKVVFENLIGNAWKYSNGTPNAEIKITCEMIKNGGMEIAIQDNGVGFDETLSERLFAPFQRLHSESDFAGNGIGLATVQRIVKKHNWKIRAKSQPGEGATFIMTIPEEKRM